MALIRTNGAPAAGGVDAVFTIMYDTSNQRTNFTQITKDTSFTASPYGSVNGYDVQIMDNEYMTATKNNSSYWSFTVKKPCKWWRVNSMHTDQWEWEDLAANTTRSNREFGTEMYVFE